MSGRWFASARCPWMSGFWTQASRKSIGPRRMLSTFWWVKATDDLNSSAATSSCSQAGASSGPGLRVLHVAAVIPRTMAPLSRRSCRFCASSAIRL